MGRSTKADRDGKWRPSEQKGRHGLLGVPKKVSARGTERKVDMRAQGRDRPPKTRGRSSDRKKEGACAHDFRHRSKGPHRGFLGGTMRWWVWMIDRAVRDTVWTKACQNFPGWLMCLGDMGGWRKEYDRNFHCDRYIIGLSHGNLHNMVRAQFSEGGATCKT